MARPWWRGEPFVDVALATFTALLVGFGTWSELRQPPWPIHSPVVAYVLALATCVALPVRRRYPVPLTLAVLALVFAYHVLGFPGEALGFTLFVTLYSVAAYGGPRSLPLALALTVVAMTPVTIAPHRVPVSEPSVYGPTIGMLCAVVLGATVRQRRVDAEQRVRQARTTAEAETRGRLAEERLRIARELHDVLAHTISVIAVQGGVALDALDDSPELAREAVRTIRRSAREALTELRAALTTLRGEGEAAQTPPQPHLSDLPALAAAARAAGLAVRVDMDGTDTDLPPVVELTAYRIVQEALTNAVRHSGAAHVWVRLRVDSGRGLPERVLCVEVGDDGRGLPDDPGTGMGLRGMRERAEAVGGTLTLGSGDGGGCRVMAELPL